MTSIPVMTTSGAALIKAGANVNLQATSGAVITQFINEAESLVNNITRNNYTDSFSSLNADVKETLGEVTSNIAGIYAIMHDMSGYTTRIEAEDMINVLRDGALRGLSILRDQKAVTFINGA